MELTARARVGITLVFVVMLLAAGMVGYGVGYQRGHWDSTGESASSVRVPAQLSVPDLVGEPLEAAHERLRTLQFSVTYELLDGGVGVVADQQPSPGTVVDRGAEVLLVEEGDRDGGTDDDDGAVGGMVKVSR